MTKELKTAFLKWVEEKREEGYLWVSQEMGLEELTGDLEMAFEAGLKAGRPRWHDIRKNPQDLPSRKDFETYSERVITDKGYSVYNFRKCRWYVDDPDCGCMVHTDVIAWTEIPKFEEAEK